MNPILQTAKNIAVRAAKSYWASLDANATPVNPGDLVTWRKATGLYLDPLQLYCFDFLTFAEYGDDTSLSTFLSRPDPVFPARFAEYYRTHAIVSTPGRNEAVLDNRIPVLFSAFDEDLRWLDPLEVVHLRSDSKLTLTHSVTRNSVSIPAGLVYKVSRASEQQWDVVLRSAFGPEVSTATQTLRVGEGGWEPDVAGLAWLAAQGG